MPEIVGTDLSPTWLSSNTIWIIAGMIIGSLLFCYWISWSMSKCEDSIHEAYKANKDSKLLGSGPLISKAKIK